MKNRVIHVNFTKKKILVAILSNIFESERLRIYLQLYKKYFTQSTYWNVRGNRDYSVADLSSLICFSTQQPIY